MLVGAVVQAREGAFITHEQRQRLGLPLEDIGKAAEVGDGVELVVDVFLGEDQLVFKQVGFNRGHAAEAPAGLRHGFDQILFDSVGGLVEVEVSLEEFREVLLRFAGDGGRLGGGPS